MAKATMTTIRAGDGDGGSVPSAARAAKVVKVFGSGPTEVQALKEVSIGFDAGAFSAIMGPSGSGKSTLLHCLCGLEPLDGGAVFIGDTELGKLTERQRTLLRRDRIGFVFQTFNLIPVLTAKENITLPMLMAGTKVDEGWFDTVVETLELTDRLHHRPTELSGGQQQRVAVARSLITKPDIVFADEPTGNLDSHSGGEVLGFLRRAVDNFDQSVVMVTHDPHAAAQADRIVFLDDGRIVDEMFTPTVEAVLDRMKQFGGE